ncbi:aprataxin and PNK-like factor [Caerostris extrusa]|uniref:Aprataxin and PNK-like factor n=1 Tax=Caerostris extrusa TaxID=172846 RepID=A0AAV4WPH9_CAEEX|nr:aprataxin and PNK-like factor [Caerostris extrusa]
MSQITLKPLDDGQKPVEIPLGKTTIGRGPLLGCSDKKVSRNHAVLEVTSKGEVFLTPTHVNPCFYQPTADNPGQILQKDIPHKLRNGDSFSLLPRAYRYQVIVVGGPKEEKNADLNDFNKPCGKPNGSTGDGFVEGIKDSVKKVSNEEQSEKAIPEKPFTKEEENVTSNKNHSIEENLSKKPTDMIDEKSLSSSKENSETKKDKEVIEKEAILPEDKNITEINVDESSSSNKSQMEHSKVNDSSGENGMNSEDYSKPLPDKEAEEKDSISQDSFPKNCSPEKATEDSYEEKEEKKVNEESLESKRTDNCEESQKDELLDKSPTKEVEEEEKVNPLPSRTEITTTSKRGRRKGAATRVNKPPKRKVSSDAPAKPKGRKKTPKFQFDEGQEGSSQRQTPGRTSSRTNRQTRQGLSLEDFIVSDDEEWQSDRSTETKKKRRKRGSRRNDDSGSDWETEHKKSKKPVHKFGSGSESGRWPRGKRRKGKATSEAEEEIEPKASSAPKSDKPRIPCTYGKNATALNLLTFWSSQHSESVILNFISSVVTALTSPVLSSSPYNSSCLLFLSSPCGNFFLIFPVTNTEAGHALLPSQKAHPSP